MAHYIWDYSVSGFRTLSCTQKSMSQKLVCSQSQVKGWRSLSSRKSRGRFTRKAMKPMLQGSSLERTPSEALGGALAMP